MHTWIELSSADFAHNVTALSLLLKPGVALGLVTKANAYGHGILPLATLAENDTRIAWLCTAGVGEAMVLRNAGITKPILAMAYHDDYVENAIIQNIALTIYDMPSLFRVVQTAEKIKQTAFVHLKIDTGLGRLGFTCENGYRAARMLHNHPFIYLQGIFTHLSDTNNPDLTFTYNQISSFDLVIKKLLLEGVVIPLVHVLPTGALFLENDFHSLVRVGTGLYGFWKSPQQQMRMLNKIPSMTLKPIMRWFSLVHNIKQTTARAGQIASIPVGYMHGYPKILEGKAYVELQGEKAKVVQVDAHQLLIDISSITGVAKGSKVLLLGGSQELSATCLASRAGTISLELTTGIDYLIPRIIVC